MTHVVDDMEIAPPSVVKQAARDFAAVLSETPQFQAFEQAAETFQKDEPAQRAMQAYESKQQSLRALLMLNAAPWRNSRNLNACARLSSLSLRWWHTWRRRMA